MGGTCGKKVIYDIDPEVEERLLRTTHFHRPELLRLYQRFCSLAKADLARSMAGIAGVAPGGAWSGGGAEPKLSQYQILLISSYSSGGLRHVNPISIHFFRLMARNMEIRKMHTDRKLDVTLFPAQHESFDEDGNTVFPNDEEANAMFGTAPLAGSSSDSEGLVRGIFDESGVTEVGFGGYEMSGSASSSSSSPSSSSSSPPARRGGSSGSSSSPSSPSSPSTRRKRKGKKKAKESSKRTKGKARKGRAGRKSRGRGRHRSESEQEEAPDDEYFGRYSYYDQLPIIDGSFHSLPVPLPQNGPSALDLEMDMSSTGDTVLGHMRGKDSFHESLAWTSVSDRVSSETKIDFIAFCEVLSPFHVEADRREKVNFLFDLYDVHYTREINATDLSDVLWSLFEGQLPREEVRSICEQAIEESKVGDATRITTYEFAQVLNKANLDKLTLAF